jgi:hypothetical protein
VYVSPVVSVFSLVSELVPVHRIEWFAFVQACMYLPIALAVHVVASRLDDRSELRRLPVTFAAAIAFSFSGIVLWTVSYPHFEVAQSGLVCIALGAAATQRYRLAWIAIVLAAGVRQDGGAHVVMGLLPLWYVTRDRRVLRMMAVAALLVIVAFVAQRLFFHPAGRLREIYFGRPAYAHLTSDLVWFRIRYFVKLVGVVWWPAAATVLVAIWRRDPRYLLGWAVTVPWFLFNFTARDGGKAGIGSYIASPFVVSMFWVYVYGAILAPARLRARTAELVLAAISLVSFGGYYPIARTWPREPLRDMVLSHPMNRELTHQLVDALGAARPQLGKVYVDDSVAALALEHFELGETWRKGIRDADTIAFHWRSWRRSEILDDIKANGLTSCTLPIGTLIYVCRKPNAPPLSLVGLETVVVPQSTLIAM